MTARAAVAIATWLACPGQALALSCVAPDPIQSFARAADASEPHIVVHGDFAFDAAAMPRGDVSDPPASAAVTARFTGMGLTSDGFTTPLSIPVTLDVVCQLTWCGGLARGTAQLAFLERRDDGFHLTLNPCPGNAFADPDAATLETIVACMTGDC